MGLDKNLLFTDQYIEIQLTSIKENRKKQVATSSYSILIEQQNSMFYERHQNFGFPITTTTNRGAVITTITGNGMNSSLNGHPTSGIDALSKLKADVKSG